MSEQVEKFIERVWKDVDDFPRRHQLQRLKEHLEPLLEAGQAMREWFDDKAEGSPASWDAALAASTTGGEK